MTVRDLSKPQRRLMDIFVQNPDASNEELAHQYGCGVDRVEKILSGVFATYRVQTRTGAVVAHLRRHPSTRRPRAVPQSESLELV